MRVQGWPRSPLSIPSLLTESRALARPPAARRLTLSGPDRGHGWADRVNERKGRFPRSACLLAPVDFGGVSRYKRALDKQAGDDLPRATFGRHSGLHVAREAVCTESRSAVAGDSDRRPRDSPAYPQPPRKARGIPPPRGTTMKGRWRIPLDHQPLVIQTKRPAFDRVFKASPEGGARWPRSGGESIDLRP